MKTTFRPGDVVVCVRSHPRRHVMAGRRYVVTDVETVSTHYDRLTVAGVHNPNWRGGFQSDRFISYEAFVAKFED